MKKKTSIISLVLFVLAGAGIGAYFLLYKDIPYYKKIEKIRVRQFTARNIQVTCDVVCYNPNQVGARLAGCDFDVYANGKLVSHVQQNTGSTIPAESDFIIPLEVNFAPTKIFKAKDLLGAAFLSLKSKKIDLKYVGDVRVALAGQDISIPVEYEDWVSLKK